ncbi:MULTISPECIES: TonB-dependent receptor plug domain-containing protein [Flavobacterium]|uniref:TonB-dependent receptor plug domain-containing protein n=1 Tax=Flavobacterium jumunjinense TaxID=998845 RepID=A0ABV5GJC9_9FLAO|nr:MULTISPECIES: TonB-dependent receptor plug domain-containing protein [Flavobacterium]
MKSKLILLFVVFSISVVFAQDSIPKQKGWRINRKPTVNVANEILYVVNSNYVSEDILKNINPNNIERVDVLKSQAATAIYGEKAQNGALVITTKNISKKELEKMYKLYAYEYSENKGKEFLLTGLILDCEENPLFGATIKNLNTKEQFFTDFEGVFKIKVRKNDVLQFEKPNYVSQKIIIEKQKAITISLKAILLSNDKPILLKKPVIYLYPTQETEITLQFEFKGELLTTFPKYEGNWKVIAAPNGQLFDTKTKRNYSSLFWDGAIDLPNEHYQYTDGFVVEKENLTDFFIEKLEHIGLNNQETNEFIQFWLPILERNEFNFIHFLKNDACNEISVNKVKPKPETVIRVYMEFYGLDHFETIKEQQLPKTNRKGFTLVEWGGADVTNKIQKDEL